MSKQRGEVALRNRGLSTESMQERDNGAMELSHSLLHQKPFDKYDDLSTEECKRFEPFEKLDCLVTKYLQDVSSLGIVSAVLVGSRKHEPGGYIWNVFIDEFNLRHAPPPPFEALNHLTYALQRDLADTIQLRISHLNPSELENLRRRCEQQVIETELIQLLP